MDAGSNLPERQGADDMSNAEIDESDMRVLIGIAATLTAHVVTEKAGAVTLEKTTERLERDLYVMVSPQTAL